MDRGTRSMDGVNYGAFRAIINKPIGAVYEWLLDHSQWKDMSRTKLAVKQRKLPGYAAFHEVEVDVNVWAFIRLQWVEQWGYAVLKGTPAAPVEILASYQKASGTDHLKRLCGSVVLKKLDANRTEIFFYEEALAPHYDSEKILQMHKDHFETIGSKKGQ